MVLRTKVISLPQLGHFHFFISQAEYDDWLQLGQSLYGNSLPPLSIPCGPIATRRKTSYPQMKVHGGNILDQFHNPQLHYIQIIPSIL